MSHSREIPKNEHLADSSQFIPLKDAERLSGYAKDYIGYLCRTNKVVAERDAIGGWTVQLDSLIRHKETTGCLRKLRMKNASPPPTIPVQQIESDAESGRKITIVSVV